MRHAANPRGPALLLVGAILLTGCTAGLGDDQTGPTGGSGTSTTAPDAAGRESTSPTPTDDPATLDEPDTAPAADDRRANPQIRRIPQAQWDRIVEVGAWRPGCPAGRAQLRRVEVNHYTFDGKVRRGVLVVNRDVAQSIARIFTTLFREQFPIRKMRPVERYGGDSNASLADDNTSAYNCRRLDQINAPPMKSPHANGRAIDINPRENPWKDLRCKCWSPSARFHKRTPGHGKILEGGLVWRTFRREGWIWQNIDVPDYMHFDTGYPSKPYRGPAAARRARDDGRGGQNR